jgi:hypothetical protein
MSIKAAPLCIALSLLAVLPLGAAPETGGTVEGVVSDITGARIRSATLTFENGVHKYTAQTRPDGTYSIKLKSGTYLVSVESSGFCTIRRGAFLLQKHSSLRFNFEMWVCPSDAEFIRFAELNVVPHTHLKPLVQFGREDFEGDLQRFRGPSTNNDGTGHARKYPAVFTFNLFRVQADVILYNPSTRLLIASGNVAWEEGTETGTGATIEFRLDGLQPNAEGYFR